MRVLAISFGVGLALALVLGFVWALVADKVIAHGVGGGLFLVGIVALALGLLGATEPPQGWRSSRDGRRSLAVQLASDHPDVERVTSLDLFIWGIVVGGGLIALSMVAFSIAA